MAMARIGFARRRLAIISAVPCLKGLVPPGGGLVLSAGKPTGEWGSCATDSGVLSAREARFVVGDVWLILPLAPARAPCELKLKLQAGLAISKDPSCFHFALRQEGGS